MKMDESENFELIINPSQEIFEQIIVQTTETENWSHQFQDYTHWRRSFDGFWLYTIVDKTTNSLVASLTLARWDVENAPTLYSIGLYYTSKNYRGNGYASRIFNEIMKKIGSENAVLFGAPAMSPKYAKTHGFDKMPDFWHLASGILMEDLKIPDLTGNSKYQLENFAEISQLEFQDFDSHICCRNRWKIMKSWFELSETFTKFAVDQNNSKIVGYGTIRICHGGKLSVAPFYADNLEIATVLLAGILKEIPNLKEKFLKIGFLHPEINEDVGRLLSEFSINGKYYSSRADRLQFTRKYLDAPQEKVYAVSDVTHQFV